MTAGRPVLPQVRLVELATGYWISQALYAAAKLGVADHLGEGPRSPAELARRVGAEPDALRRLLRCLASYGVFEEQADGAFAATPLSRLLARDAPRSLRPLVVMLGEEMYRAWGELLYSVRTGRPAFERIFGRPFFRHYGEDAAAGEIHRWGMAAVAGLLFVPALAAYDFSGFGTVVDVGGGVGVLLVELLGRHPGLRGILCERPEVAEAARSHIAAAGLTERCRVVEGDLFTGVPAEGDAYLLSHVLHDWSDEECLAILGSCRAAMGEEARLLILEKIVPPGGEPHLSKLDDLNMLVLTSGRERTQGEYEALLRRGGFRLTRVVSASSPASLLEAIPEGEAGRS